MRSVRFTGFTLTQDIKYDLGTSVYCNVLNVKLHSLHSEALTQALDGEFRCSVDVVEEQSCKQREIRRTCDHGMS